MEIRRSTDYDEIRPLVELCKAGKLLEVQAWIAAGQPVNPPPIPVKGNRRKSPLEVAIAAGFHTLVQVLLQAGAVIEPVDRNGPMNRALEMRRFDLIQLLVEHGYDPKAVNMREVFDTWDVRIMEYFIEHGADIERRNPFAYAFCQRIKTALGVFKKYRDRFSTLPEQANIGLRYHCMNGNQRWVALMLWVGADPLAKGTENFDEEDISQEHGLTALGFAALRGHFELFRLKGVQLDIKHPAMHDVLYFACRPGGIEIVKRLLEDGLAPNDQENGGCSNIGPLVQSMTYRGRSYSWMGDFDQTKIDTDDARICMQAIHLLVKHGARWIPKEKREINSTRRALLQMIPDYTVEFAWIVWKYKASDLESMRQLLSTPTMKSHLAKYRDRVAELLATWGSAVGP